MHQVTLYVMGICCFNRFHSIEEGVRALSGIISFKGSLPKGKIVIKFKPSLVSHMEIINRIEEEGYQIAKKVRQESYCEIYN